MNAIAAGMPLMHAADDKKIEKQHIGSIKKRKGIAAPW
jgi:hypothetical protein